MNEKWSAVRLEVADVRSLPERYAPVTEESFKDPESGIEFLNQNPQLLGAMKLFQIVSVDDDSLILNDGQIRERVRVRR